MTNPLVLAATYSKRPLKMRGENVVDADKLTRELGLIEGALKYATSLAGTVFNVLDFGADPTGARDSTTAFQKALTTMTAGSVLLIPSGTYRISANLTKSDTAGLVIVASGATIYTTDMSLTGVFTFTDCERLTWEGGYFLGAETDAYFQANSPSAERSFLYLDGCERALVTHIAGKDKRRLLTALNSHYLTIDDYKFVGFFPDYSAGVVPNGNHAPTVTIKGCDYSHISNGSANNCGSVLLGQFSSEHVTVTGISGHDLHDNCVYVSSGYDWTISNVTSKDNNGNTVQTRGPRMTLNNITGVGLLTDYVVDMTGFGLAADADGADADGYSLVCSNIVSHGCLGAINLGGPNNGFYARDITASNITAYDSVTTGENAPVVILAHSGVILTNVTVRGTSSDIGVMVQGEDASNRLDGLMISDVRVTDVNGSAASTRGGLRVVYATNVTIRGGVFADIDAGIGVRLNSVVNGIVSDNQYDGGQVVRVPSGESNAGLRVYDNLGASLFLDSAAVTAYRNAGYVTENNGTATVANGTTTVVVNHGLAQTPDVQDISVTPTNNLGTAAKFWISTVTATQFTINVDADPGAGTATFAWTASIQ